MSQLCGAQAPGVAELGLGTGDGSCPALVYSGMRLMGRCAGLARRAAGWTARGFIVSCRKTIRVLDLASKIRPRAGGREVTGQKKGQEQLRPQREELARIDKMVTLGRLVSSVAHEISNPSAVLMEAGTLLSQAWEDVLLILEEHYRQNGDFRIGRMTYSEMRPQMPLLLRDVRESVERISRIVSDLKHFSREAQRNLLRNADLNRIVKTACRLTSKHISRATRRFTIDCASDLPALRADPLRLEQVMVNLLLNASQALPDPDRGIHVSTSFDEPGGRLVVRIRDEGLGIAPENLRRIREPFFTTKCENGGLGLGLYVSSTIVAEHGGTMEFESASGEGTTVTVAFPAVVDAVAVATGVRQPVQSFPCGSPGIRQ